MADIDIDRNYRKFRLQGVVLILGLSLALYAAMKIFSLPAMMVPLLVSMIFAIVVATADAVVWKRVAKGSPESLPTFFMAVSGIRMLLALAVMFVYYLAAEGQSMLTFFLVFIAYYVMLLVHHTVFFAKDRTAA